MLRILTIMLVIGLCGCAAKPVVRQVPQTVQPRIVQPRVAEPKIDFRDGDCPDGNCPIR
jgi:hypothetical protein